MNAKPIVFISHIAHEKQVATSLKELVERSFLGMIDVFVSSDPRSLQPGEKWLPSIANALRSCVVEIIIASPASVLRPWINFEAGTGWIRDIPVIPLCHSGMTPRKLPAPLNTLQAARATDETELKNVLPILAKAIGCDQPIIDFSAFINAVRDFEEQVKIASPVDQEIAFSINDTSQSHESARFINRRDGAVGTWTGVSQQDEGPEGVPVEIPMVFDLLPRGSGLIGIGTVSYSNPEAPQDFNLKITARPVSESLIKFEYTSSDPSILHHGGGMMILSPDATRLHVKYAGFSVLLGRLVTGALTLSKQTPRPN